MASNLNPQQKRRIFCVVAVIGIAIVTILDGGSSLPSILDESARESRLLRPSQSRRDPVYRWARNKLKPLSKPPNHKTETSVFWHIPKSGGSTAEKIYECLGQSLANRVGALPQFGHSGDKELVAFKPWDVHGIDATYVNVDTSTPEGIIHAAAMGLVPSHMADIIFTGDPNFAVEHLFDEKTKGRVYVLFRHPIDRLVSKFYYLQTATWERTYAPSWKKLSILEWAESHNRDQGKSECMASLTNLL